MNTPWRGAGEIKSLKGFIICHSLPVLQTRDVVVVDLSDVANRQLAALGNEDERKDKQNTPPGPSTWAALDSDQWAHPCEWQCR